MNQQLRKFQSRLGVFYVPLIILILSIFVFLIGYTEVQPEQYNFRINQVAEETVQAPVTIEDTEQTEINRERARNNVTDAFVFQPAISEEQIDLVNQYYALIKEIREKEYSTEDINQMIGENDFNVVIDESPTENERTKTQSVPYGQLEDIEKQVVYHSRVSEIEDNRLIELSGVLSVESINTILNSSDGDLNEVRNQITEFLSVILSKEIESTDLNQEVSSVNSQVSELNYTEENQAMIREMMQELIVPTVIFSESETEKRREEAGNAVQPSYILQGQIVVQEGHIIDQTTYRQLDLLGYLDRRSNNNLLIVFSIIVLVHAMALFFMFFKEKKDALSDFEIGSNVTAYVLLFCVSFLVLKILHIIQMNGTDYAMILLPIYIIPLLLSPRTNLKLTLFFITFFNLFALFVTHDGDSMTVTLIITVFYLFSSLISLSYQMFVNNKKSLRQGFLYSLILHIIFVVPIVLMINVTLISEPSINILSFVLFNLFITFGIYFFIEPYWHKLLSSKAPLTLNQLANLNHPLLKRIVEKAPGSYHHSMMVANIAANAAEAINADSQLVRIASYYHDVGKTLHPLFFIENLSDGMESPHAMITPQESAAIIIDHVVEGEKLLRVHDMPESIIDICMQHHGTTLVRYFYHQAQQEDKQVDKSDFQYPGPKPQSKEAILIMIADSIEAASRTIKDHTQTTFETLVQNIINGKLSDGQFDECGLTVSELEVVRKSMIYTVASMYHTRIEYPD